MVPVIIRHRTITTSIMKSMIFTVITRRTVYSTVKDSTQTEIFSLEKNKDKHARTLTKMVISPINMITVWNVSVHTTLLMPP